MAFYQVPPTIDDPFATDRVLRSYLARVLPADVAGVVVPTREGRWAIGGGER
jgi:acyl-CoA dehydrogenase